LKADQISTSKAEGNDMKDSEDKANKTSLALVGFAAGVLTVLLVLFAIKGC
jgi:hypothetical protein